MLKELIIRLLQTEAKHSILHATSDTCNNNRMAHVVDYIKKNITHKLTIKELADKAFMSPSHFHRRFKDYVGQSPVAFILHERIRFSIKLMMNSTLSLHEIATLAGFNTPAYFTRQFKRIMRVSPNAYRKTKMSLEAQQNK